jgi:hypothetical protein
MNRNENPRGDTSLEGQVVYGQKGPERLGCEYDPRSCGNLRVGSDGRWCLIAYNRYIPHCGKVPQEPK